ncbi:MAG: BON domain-containing protein [Casimicrobiaceae bacterium]
MNSTKRIPLILALVAGVTLVGAGCSDRDADRSAAARNSTVNKTATPAAAATTRAAVAVDDTMITTSVKTKVLAEPGLSALKIEVDTKNGVVTLTGTVDNADLKSRAAQIAQSTDGVRSVENNLTVKAG